MKVLLALIVLLSVHRAVSEDQCDGVTDFTFGFQDKKLHAVEGGPYTYCIVAVCNSAPAGGITFNVRRSLPDQVTFFLDEFTISEGFDITDDPVCMTVNAADDDRLGPGDTILLAIQDIVGDASADPDCITAEVNVFEDEVIEFEIKDEEDIIYADEGDMSVDVCVHVTCVEGPTEGSFPILFYNIEVEGLAERQKKIVLIPKGTMNDAKICCTFQLNPDFDVPEDEFVDIPVHVKSEELNVLGLDYATIRVHDVPIDDSCDVCFINDSPEVDGTSIRISLPPCVTSATCTLPGISVPCNGQMDTVLETGRNTYLTLGVSVDAPDFADPMSLSRRLRIDVTGRCDSHLLNKGFVHNDEDGSHTLEFEGTGGTGGPITTFYCTVESPLGTVIVPTAECDTAADSTFVQYTFAVPDGTTAFYARVVPHPPAGILCTNAHERIYHYQAPDIIIEP